MGDSLFTWYGAFATSQLERGYRRSCWQEMMEGGVRTCALAAFGFLLAGFFLLPEEGPTSLASFLVFLRVMVALTGILPLMLIETPYSLRFTPSLVTAFVICVGAYESVVAVLTYTPGLVCSTPYTLLMVLLCYFLAPLTLTYTMAAGLIASMIYIFALKVCVVHEWSDLFQLVFFFAVVNILGTSIFIYMAKLRRRHFMDMAEIRQLNETLQQEVMRKEVVNRHLEHLSITDSLTGVGNRRKFLDMADLERRRAHRYGTPFSLVMIDIDHFKEVNDRYGHEGGDVALCELTRVVGEQLRDSDLLTRLGGEEFAILLPQTPKREAWLLAERVRQLVAAHVVSIGVVHFSITISMGVTDTRMGRLDSVKGMLNRADTALYKAKAEGRNRTEMYSSTRSDETSIV